jgi:hypothetical protein
MGVYLMGVYLVSVYLINTGAHLMGVHLIGAVVPTSRTKSLAWRTGRLVWRSLMPGIE